MQGKQSELIKEIGLDYDAAWEYLESIYGDPRFVADTITQDIARFKPLRDGEDARFCDLVHLVKRRFNTLAEVGRQNDKDSNHAGERLLNKNVFRRPQSLVTPHWKR